VCGDGGFMMNSQEMETAVRLRLNVVVPVLQDDAYGMIRWKQQVDGFADSGMTFGNPDFAAYARAHYAVPMRRTRGAFGFSWRKRASKPTCRSPQSTAGSTGE